MKTLVIVTHPNPETSIINKRWVEELKKYPEKYTVHELYKSYPDGKIDVEKEQQLIESHGNLVLQFPLYWFNSPPLLKQWLDEVFTYGWAYGSSGDKLKNRKAALAVSVGGEEQLYQKEGKFNRTMDEILSPFETTFLYCKSDYRSFFSIYGVETNTPPADELDKNAQDYVKFIDNM
ncbi:NAD(P)H-dependent oxidoreductase [Paenibacillus herberti]|uniref:NAD(P)H oxidoreductase n=1 Tax=Paenibacillus herberti TaxID=1619309 RepID=A0A229NZS4_9BACL|nr:NAD(P)H-dependent oxidoreductase [Paenibacillus herberti]OXM15175.1 NAD(P)H oxidoreductase [Paenibacillus herberti]